MNPTNYLRETVDLIKQIETRYLELGRRFYNIKEKELWKGTHDSFQEFLDVAKVNPGHASILMSIHKAYVVDGKIEFKSLGAIGYSNLYEAIPLIEKHGVDNTIVMAATLTRAEIKDEVREEKHGTHEHNLSAEKWSSCKTCGKFIRT